MLSAGWIRFGILKFIGFALKGLLVNVIWRTSLCVGFPGQMFHGSGVQGSEFAPLSNLIWDFSSNSYHYLHQFGMLTSHVTRMAPMKAPKGKLVVTIPPARIIEAFSLSDNYNNFNQVTSKNSHQKDIHVANDYSNQLVAKDLGISYQERPPKHRSRMIFFEVKSSGHSVKCQSAW